MIIPCIYSDITDAEFCMLFDCECFGGKTCEYNKVLKKAADSIKRDSNTIITQEKSIGAF